MRRGGFGRRPRAGCGPALLCLAFLAGGPVGGWPIASAAHASTTNGGCAPGSGLTLSVDQPNATAPSTVAFQVTDPRGPPDWVNWSFGDGNSVNNSSSTYLSIAHVYSSIGSFPALMVLSQGGSLASCSATVDVQPAPFSVVIRAQPTTGTAPVTVEFTAEVSGGTSTYQSAVWSFGDGQGGTGFNVSYTYAHPGTYLAVLSVVDSADQVAVANVTVHVAAATSSGPSPDGGIPSWAIVLGLVGVVAVGVGVVALRRRGPRGSSDDGGPEGPFAGPPGSELLGPAGPEAVGSAPPMPPAPEFGPDLPVAGSAPEGNVGAAPEAAAASRVPRRRAVEAEEAGGPGRLKLSQRVMLHLYRQGHLGDGEVAPVGFTQGGMSDALEVAQSPLSSVLRRLVVAGLVVQDTRHVRGQPRRLRVYRLSPLGESVARDLYHHPPRDSGPRAGSDAADRMLGLDTPSNEDPIGENRG